MFQIMQQPEILGTRTSGKRLLQKQRGSFSVSSEFLKYTSAHEQTPSGCKFSHQMVGLGRAAVNHLQVARRKSLLTVNPLLETSFLFE